MFHTFPFTPKNILFWPKSSFLSTSSISLLLAFYWSCAISTASFADSSAGICQIRTWMLWKLSGTRLFHVGKNFLDMNFLDPNILKQFIGPIFPTQIFWTRNFWSQIFWTRIFGPEFFGPELFEPIFWINLLDIHIPSP